MVGPVRLAMVATSSLLAVCLAAAGPSSALLRPVATTAKTTIKAKKRMALKRDTNFLGGSTFTKQEAGFTNSQTITTTVRFCHDHTYSFRYVFADAAVLGNARQVDFHGSWRIVITKATISPPGSQGFNISIPNTAEGYQEVHPAGSQPYPPPPPPSGTFLLQRSGVAFILSQATWPYITSPLIRSPSGC